MSDDLLHVAAQLERGITPEDRSDLAQRVIVIVEGHILSVIPVRSGKLKASTDIRYDADGGEIVFGADYAIFVHEPTKPHKIMGNPVLRFIHGGETVFAHYVREHPGTPGQPFIDWGLDRAEGDINAALLDAGAAILGGML